MELDYNGRNEFRERINEKLKDVEFNPKKRISLPIDRLEKLLFEKKVDKDGNIYKIIGFLFDNICKLDLSNLSFEDVSFNNDSYVDLGNTNAKIEFDKSYEFKKNNEVIVKNTSFKNVDLSNNNFEYLTTNKKATFTDCDLSDTKIRFGGWNRMDVFNCNLSNLNFEGVNVYIYGIDDDGQLVLNNDDDDEVRFRNCNFSNTKVNIANMSVHLSPASKDKIKELVTKGYLDGCYLNGKLIETEENRLKNNVNVISEYVLYKSHFINDTLDLIDEQLSKDGGRITYKKTLKKTNNNTLDKYDEDEADYQRFIGYNG